MSIQKDQNGVQRALEHTQVWRSGRRGELVKGTRRRNCRIRGARCHWSWGTFLQVLGRGEFVLWQYFCLTEVKPVRGWWEAALSPQNSGERPVKGPIALGGALVTSRGSVLITFLLTEEAGVMGEDGLAFMLLWGLFKRVSLVTNDFSLLFSPMIAVCMMHDGRCLCRLSFLGGSQSPEKHLCMVPVESGLLMCWL